MTAHNRASRLFLLALSLIACSDDAPTSLPGSPIPATPPLVPPIVLATTDVGVRIRVVTTGTDVDRDGYVVRIQLGYSGGIRDLPIGVNDSTLFTMKATPPWEGWFIRLIGLESNCWVGLPNTRQVAVRADAIPQLDYSVECIAPNHIRNYDRVSGHWPGNLSFHGNLSQRYVFRDDGLFRLQYTSDRFGFFEYLGAFTRSATGVLLLQYDGDSRWQATGTLRGDSLVVDYNDIMIHSDFEPGVFVRR